VGFLSTVHGALANATTKQEAETPPPRQPSPPPPKKQHQHRSQASGSDEQSGGAESGGGLMHPERVSRHRKTLVKWLVWLQANSANDPNSKHCWQVRHASSRRRLMFQMAFQVCRFPSMLAQVCIQTVWR